MMNAPRTLAVCILQSLIFTWVAGAAPLPATPSNSIIADQTQPFVSEFGFKMSSANTDWKLMPKPADSKYMVTLYQSPQAYKSLSATLTVRLDHLNEKMETQDYVKKWLKRYPRFGFEVLGAKNFEHKGHTGYVIDLLNKENERQLRQVVFLKDKAAIVMTCRDHIDNFKNSLKSCNDIIRTFEWTEANF